MSKMDGVLDNNETEAVVIGGMVLDINATPSVPANRGTTTPGKVYCVDLNMNIIFC